MSSYYDPFADSSPHQQRFRAEDLYKFERLPSPSNTMPGSPAHSMVPPGLTPNLPTSHSTVASVDTEDTQSNSASIPQRRRLTKPRPTSLSVGLGGSSIRPLPVPITLRRATSSEDDLYGPTLPGSAQTLFHSPPSASFPGTYSISDAAFDNARANKSNFVLGPYDYSLPASADADTTQLLSEKDPFGFKKWPSSPSYPSSPYMPSLPYRSTTSSLKRQKGLFEPPPRILLIIHCTLCAVAWPTIYFMSPLVRSSLFWTRAYVGVLCSAFGIPISFSLLELVRRWAEAAAWATAIHQSEAKSGGAGGIRMQEIAGMTSDPTSAWVGVKMLWARLTSHSLARKERRSYDRRPWSLFISFFLVVVICEASLTFTLGRIVVIDTAVKHQNITYHEVLVPGDLSSADLEAAADQSAAFNDFVRTWTLAPFASSDAQAPVVSFVWEGERVYFTEATIKQLTPGGTGRGTFQMNSTDATRHREVLRRDTESAQGFTRSRPESIALGSILRYPKWGIRIHCAKLPDPELHLTPLSETNKTYVLLPRTLIRELFSSFELTMPARFENPFNQTKVLETNDTLPEGLDPDSIVAGGKFWNNGVAHSFWSIPVNMSTVEDPGAGWTQIETVLVRLNASLTPHGSFPLYNPPPTLDMSGSFNYDDSVGYDAAVCLERYESWVLDTANGTALPEALRIAGRGTSVLDVPAPLATRKGPPVGGLEMHRNLNATDKFVAFGVAHANSVNQMIKDNGRDQWYVPSPTVVSFTSGAGAEGYTALSPEHFGAARAMADATNVLPYLAGRGLLLARSFPDHTIAWAHVSAIPLAIVLGVALLLGVVAGFCAPRLPGGAPRRDTGMWGWVAVLAADGILDEARARGVGRVEREMELEEVEKLMGGLRVRYTAVQ